MILLSTCTLKFSKIYSQAIFENLQSGHHGHRGGGRGGGGGAETYPNETEVQGFAPFAALISEDLLEFTSRPKVAEFLARTGAKSTDDVIKYGFTEEFFATFEGEIPLIPREKAKEFLKIHKNPAIGPNGLPISTPSATVESQRN